MFAFLQTCNEYLPSKKALFNFFINITAEDDQYDWFKLKNNFF